VWCFGGCWKEECAYRRQELQTLAEQLGSSALCFKKGNSSFGRWADGTPAHLITVVTDWREAKPCIQAIERSGKSCSVVSMVIICDTLRQVSRARALADSLPSEFGAVHVCVSSDTKPGDIAEMILKSFAPGVVQELMEKSRMLQEVQHQLDELGDAVDSDNSGDSSPVSSRGSSQENATTGAMKGAYSIGDADTTCSESGESDTSGSQQTESIMVIDSFLEVPSSNTKVSIRHRASGMTFSVRNSFLEFQEQHEAPRRALSLNSRLSRA
jgi:hypothetical protein